MILKEKEVIIPKIENNIYLLEHVSKKVVNELRPNEILNRFVISITDDNGSAISITVMLGGQLPQQATLNFSECWNLSDTGKKRRLAIRNVRLRRPMKSRMFNSRNVCEFDWVYDAESLEGMTIEGWFNQWKDNEFKKIAIPS